MHVKLLHLGIFLGVRKLFSYRLRVWARFCYERMSEFFRAYQNISLVFLSISLYPLVFEKVT